MSEEKKIVSLEEKRKMAARKVSQAGLPIEKRLADLEEDFQFLATRYMDLEEENFSLIERVGKVEDRLIQLIALLTRS